MIRTKTTVLQAIALAGGLAPFAAKQRIQVRREINGAETVLLFDYRAFEAGTNLENNIELRANDVIIVPNGACSNNRDCSSDVCWLSDCFDLTST